MSLGLETTLQGAGACQLQAFIHRKESLAGAFSLHLYVFVTVAQGQTLVLI